MAYDLSPIVVDNDGWRFRYDTQSARIRSGERSLRLVIPTGITVREKSTCSAFQMVELEPDAEYELSAWYAGECTGSGAGLGVEWDEGDPGARRIVRLYASGYPSTDVWTEMRLRFRTGTDVRAARVVLSLFGQGEVFFDDVTLVPVGNRALNLLHNPGFEEDRVGWHEGKLPGQLGAVEITHGRFVPWGLNYDRSMIGCEDYILEEMLVRNPAKVRQDMQKAKALGANVLRVFLQLAHFEPRLGEMDELMMERFDQVVHWARELDLRLDVTGLSHIDKNTLPAWYHTGTNEEILAGEAHFWASIAKRYRAEPAIFCFNLQNEPYLNMNDGAYEPVGCFTMSRGRQFCYCHPHPKWVKQAWSEYVHARYPSEAELREAWPDYPLPGETYDRPLLPVEIGGGLRDHSLRRYLDFAGWRREYAFIWVETMVRAIRQHDSKRLVTLGFLPNSLPLTPEEEAGFNPQEVGGLLDFISIHLYPQFRWEVPQDSPASRLEAQLRGLEMLLRAAFIGRPIVVEEWNALGDLFTNQELEARRWFGLFLEHTLDDASGWLTFYHGILSHEVSLEELGRLNEGDSWEAEFFKAAERVKEQSLSRAQGEIQWILDTMECALDRKRCHQLLERYLSMRKAGKNVDIRFLAKASNSQ